MKSGKVKSGDHSARPVRTRVREIARRPIAAIVAENNREEVAESPEPDLGPGGQKNKSRVRPIEKRARDVPGNFWNWER